MIIIEAMEKDDHLLSLMEKYDGWVRSGKLPYVGKILPIGEALQTRQWILPTSQAIQMLSQARSYALADCTCRTHYQRCEHPRNTCLLVGDMADDWVEAGRAERVSFEMAARTLRIAERCGLVHQAAYNPEQYIWALCSCCSCCCFRLQVLLLHDREDLVVRSDYVAVTDQALCNHCGVCAPRCAFGGREFREEKVVLYADKCFGCGLCVTACPEKAIQLETQGGESL